jgi:beta-glucosidase
MVKPCFWGRFVMFLAVATTSSCFAQGPVIGDDARKQAQQLLHQMTVEEKIGQLNLVSGSNKSRPPYISDEEIAQGKIGSVLWLADPAEINRIQHVAVEKSRLHIPILFGLDVIHGYRTMFPIPLAMASSWDPSVEERAQQFAAKEARAEGIRWTFTPMVDIARDARWGRIQEGAGEDPYLGSAMAVAQIKGFQGETLGRESIVACVKHFAGYGAADGGRDYDGSYIPEDVLRNVYLRPFQAAVEAGVGSLMSAYMDLNDVPASGNYFLLTEVLRKEWHFDGFVVSDESAIAKLTTHGYANSPEEASLKAINAGAGIDMASRTFINNLPKLLAEGKVKEAQLDAAVLPILAIKYQIGLFVHPYTDAEASANPQTHTDGLALSRKLAARSMVLLKNEKNILPISPDQKKVAVIGILADSAIDTQGGPTAKAMFTHEETASGITVLAALKEVLKPGTQLNYVPGPDMPRLFPSAFELATGKSMAKSPTPKEVARWLRRTKTAASEADLVIAVLGERESMSGEGSSRATLDLPGVQEQMLEAAVASGKPVIVVLINGRPLDIHWAAEHVNAILEAWLPGEQGGNAVADIIFGTQNPGGKLPLSWPRAAGQEPLYYNHNSTQQPEDSTRFTSRYWDMSSLPLYRFGFGLSYSTFSYTNLRLTDSQIAAGSTTQVQVDVTNTSKVAGDAVAELYIHQNIGAISRPVRQLEGFNRVTLNPGETRTLTFVLGPHELSYWHPDSKTWLTDPGRFGVFVGEDSTATLTKQLVVLP